MRRIVAVDGVDVARALRERHRTRAHRRGGGLRTVDGVDGGELGRPGRGRDVDGALRVLGALLLRRTDGSVVAKCRVHAGSVGAVRPAYTAAFIRRSPVLPSTVRDQGAMHAPSSSAATSF